MTHLPPKLSKLLIVGLLTQLLSVVFGGQALAEDDFAAEGERRAKLAGSELIGTPAPQRVLTTLTGETLNLQQLYGSKLYTSSFGQLGVFHVASKCRGLKKFISSTVRSCK